METTSVLTGIYLDNAWDQVFAYRLNGDFTTFNTFIQTCKQVGVPFMSYFKKVMNELKNGRTDYQNLLPATIQI